MPAPLRPTPLAIAMSALFLAAPVYADPTLELLDQVVVTGSRESTLLRRTPAAIHHVSRKTLDEKHPVFVGQVLNQASGVYVTDLGNEQHNMSIRQPLSYNAVYLYLEDGLPIRPVGLFNHNALYEINLTGVGDVEVIKGPASSLYGSNAVGGAVNFFTRAGGPHPQATIGMQVSDQGYRREEYSLSGGNEGQQLRISGYHARRRGGWQEHNAADKDGVTLRHDAALGDSASLVTVFSYNRLLTDMPGSLNESDYRQRPGFSYNTFTWRKVEASRLSTQLTGSTNAGGHSSLTVYARSNTTDQLPSYLIFNTGSSSAAGRLSVQRFTSLGLDARHRQDLFDSRWRVILGVSAERSPVTAREVNLAIVRDPQTGRYLRYSNGLVRRDYQVDITNQALYAQSEYTPVESVRLVAGLRSDDIRYDYTNHLLPSPTTGAPSESRRYRHVSPKLGATWDITPRINGYANASQGFTPPEVSAQYGGSLTAPSLKEATFTNIDTGVRWVNVSRTINADISVYRLEGKDEILSWSVAPGVSIPVNAGKTRHQGIEFGVDWHPAGQWDAKLNGAFARHSYRSYALSATQRFDGKAIPAAPHWLVNGELGYQPLSGLRLAAETQYLGSYYMDDANTVRYPGHVLVNLRANYRHGEWEVWGAVLNAGNRRYAEIAASSYKGTGTYQPDSQNTYTPGAPRTAMLGVQYRLDGK